MKIDFCTKFNFCNVSFDCILRKPKSTLGHTTVTLDWNCLKVNGIRTEWRVLKPEGNSQKASVDWTSEV